MEKKRSVGVIITSIVFILLSLFFLVPALVSYNGNWPRLLSYGLWLISGIGLLFFKNWARILSLLPMAYLLIIDTIFHRELIELPIKVVWIFFIIYLTRPKVKEWFQ